MRLWHKDLISVLPQKQLLAQWREICAITKNIATKGTPNHILVNKILNYPVFHFNYYVDMVIREMHNRGYVVNRNAYSNFLDNLNEAKQYFPDGDVKILDDKILYKDWMNNRYLLQCYRNLQEKYDCGAISDEDMNKIFQVYESKIGTRIYKM